MRAVSQRILGGPGVLEIVEVPRPNPGRGEALIRVYAASVNAADWKRRSGLLRRFGDPPFTVGLDFSGVVVSLGGPTTPVRPGDPVYGVVLPPAGSHAEYVVAPVDALALAPRSIDLVSAAALPVAALTARQSLVRVAGVAPGDRVLIHAAAGGVSHLAVQIAKARGAHVIGTARSGKHWLPP
jgi:NADPH:quinone reductase-like Zn-dependent oxidoreductase